MKKTFPYLSVRGTHKDVGFAIGETFRDKIQESVSLRASTIPNYSELRQTAQNHFLATLKVFPNIVEELTATAIASKVGLMDLFFANTRSLYDSGVTSEAGDVVIHDRCTTLVSFGKDGPIIGHNEDWGIENIDDLYILKATIGKTTTLGLNYYWELPGTSAAMNSWGLVQGINEVHQKELVGIPKNFIARAILQCRDLDEATHLLKKTLQDTGFNHVLVQKDTVKNVEIAGGEISILSLRNKPYVHTNHFLSTLSKYETYHTKSSDHRYVRAIELMKNNMTEGDIINVLSDKKDEEYPICRHDSTIASMIFTPSKGEVKICYGPPCQGEFVKYTI